MQMLHELRDLQLAELEIHVLYRTFLQEVSKPEGSLEPVVTPSLSSHRPLLATARRLIGEVKHFSCCLIQSRSQQEEPHHRASILP